MQEYPIKTPSLRSLAPKEEAKQQRSEKSTLKLFGLTEGTFAPPGVPRIGDPDTIQLLGQPNVVQLLAPPNVNAPAPVRKKPPALKVREGAPIAPAVARQRPSIAWLALAVTLLTFGWWVLFRSPPGSTAATAPSGTSTPQGAMAAYRPAGEPPTGSARTGTAAAEAPANQAAPAAAVAKSEASSDRDSAKDGSASPTAATTRAPTSTGTAATSAGSATKSSLVAKTGTTTKSKSSAATKSSSSSSSSAAFDAAAARNALNRAAASASSCRQLGDPAGTAKVMVTFAPSGRVTSSVLAGALFSGTRAGGCIAARMRSASIPPFSGGPVTVSKRIAVE